jgi:uncharacterized protein YeaO (DUF488 family)
MLGTKSVWTPINRRADGLRILVTRIRGHGLPASRYDVWMPNLGPSERLLGAGLPTGTAGWRRVRWCRRERTRTSITTVESPACLLERTSIF